MIVKNKTRQCLIFNRLSLLFFLIITVGCTNQQASLTPKKLDTSTQDKIQDKIQDKSSSKQKSLSVTTETNSEILSLKTTVQPQKLASSPTTTTNPSYLEYGWNKNLKVDNVAYDLYIPANYRQHQITHSLLVLPGWNYPRTSWIENTNLVEYSDRYGYILILPEMEKTLYASAYYPETTMKWNAIAGGAFITNRFIPSIQQKHSLLKSDQYNTLLGLSTGGRGVALIALENPDLFAAGASLSGDFSPENTPGDRLMTSVYGSFWQFKTRWMGKDNPQSRVAEWKMSLYLAHGMQDNIVPESQSRLFYNALINHHGDRVTVEYNSVQNAQHDYQFWGGQLPYVFQFFSTIEQQQDSNSNSN